MTGGARFLLLIIVEEEDLAYSGGLTYHGDEITYHGDDTGYHGG